ncbi:hypothetical protein [Marivita sp.]
MRDLVKMGKTRRDDRFGATYPVQPHGQYRAVLASARHSLYIRA